VCPTRIFLVGKKNLFEKWPNFLGETPCGHLPGGFSHFGPLGSLNPLLGGKNSGKVPYPLLPNGAKIEIKT